MLLLSLLLRFLSLLIFLLAVGYCCFTSSDFDILSTFITVHIVASISGTTVNVTAYLIYLFLLSSVLVMVVVVVGDIY